MIYDNHKTYQLIIYDNQNICVYTKYYICKYKYTYIHTLEVAYGPLM